MTGRVTTERGDWDRGLEDQRGVRHGRDWVRVRPTADETATRACETADMDPESLCR